jgi:hypothetical protein
MSARTRQLYSSPPNFLGFSGTIFAFITSLLMTSSAVAIESLDGGPSMVSFTKSRQGAGQAEYLMFEQDGEAATSPSERPSRALIRVLQQPPYVPLQLVSVEVALETDDLIVGAVDIQYPMLGGATWIESTRATVNGARQHRGQSVTVLSTSIRLFLRDVGMLNVPSMELRVPVLEQGVRRDLIALTEPLSIEVTLPAELSGVSYVPASSIRMKSKWNSEIAYALGQIVEQEVLVEAEGVLPIAFPDWGVPLIDGLKSQVLPPISDLSASRGAVTATLNFRARHRLEQTGTYALSPYQINWWDTERHILTRIESESVQFDVLEAESDSDNLRRWLELIGSMLAVLGLAFGLWRGGLRCKTIWSRFRQPVLDERLNP